MFTKSDIIFNNILPKIKYERGEVIEINKLYRFFKSIRLQEYGEISSSFSKGSYNSTHELMFASEKVKKEIHTQDNKYSFTLRFKSNLVTINIYSKDHIENTNFIHELKNYIQFILSIRPTKVDIEINYFLTDQKKTLKKRIPTKDDINSGSCLTMSNKCIINIWRKEEILKVTLHEMFHALKFSHYSDRDDILHHFKQKYKISSKKINTDEAYTEIWANLINCFLISKKFGNNVKELFIKSVLIEKEYSLFQAKKIIHNSLKPDLDLDKNTNVTSYFLIRAELYNNLKEFLKYCRTKNENYVKIKDISSWFDTLISGEKIEQSNNLFQREGDDDLFRNLRMSILELDIQPN